MSRTNFAILMSFLALFSCQKFDNIQPDTGSESNIRISVCLPEGMGVVRSQENPGNGDMVNRCIMEVYLDGQQYGERMVSKVENKQATFDARLITGKSYRLVFWADYADGDAPENFTDKYYSTANLSNVTMLNADQYSGSNDGRDAFYAVKELSDFTSSSSISVELRRPFGQLNVKTLDMGDVPAGLLPTNVSISFDDVPTGINLLTGELTGDVKDIAYADAVALADNEGNAGKLTFDYIFAPKTEGEQRLVNFTMSFLNDAGAEVATAYEFNNIPVQRNYRTNVSGYLLTKKADVNVAVVPEFDGTIDKTITEVSSLIDLNNFLVYGGNARLESDLTIAGSSMIMALKEVNLDLNGHTLTLANNNGATCCYNIYTNTTISNGKIVAKMSSPDDAAIVCGSGYSVTLDDVEFESEGSCVGTASNTSNATIVVRNSSLKCRTYAVSTIAANPVGNNIKISIEGSTLEALTPVLVNVPCDLTIDASTVTAQMQALILRGGTATVSNSTLTLDTDASFSSQADAEEFANAFDSSDWGTGNMVNMAAVTAGNKGGNSYQYPTVLNLENSTVQTIGAYASLFPAMYVWANEGEGLGVTVNYDEDCKIGDITCGSSNITVNGVERNI